MSKTEPPGVQPRRWVASSCQENPASAHRKGILLMAGAGLCWSTGGILVRSVTLTDPWEIVLWRSIFMVLFLTGILSLWHRTSVIEKVVEVGIHGVLSGLFLGSTFFFFILSVTRTTVANTLVLMSTSPLMIALLGRFLLGERIRPRTWAAIFVALAGITLMFSEGMDQGQILGNFLALGIPLAFGMNIVVLRRAKTHVNMIPAVLLAGIFSIFLALPLAWPLSISPWDLIVLAVMGCVQLGLGCILMTLAVRYISASEIGLLSLLETTLGPLWVWMGIGERPSNLALAGGAIVIGALLANELKGLAGKAKRGEPE